MRIRDEVGGPHAGQPVSMAGAPLSEAAAALILIHGRGATAESILDLGRAVAGDGTALLAPRAAGQTWYPQRFLMPLQSNEPWLSSALAAVGDVVAQLEAAGIPATRQVLLGFSQGACLVTEWAARHARRYGAMVGLSGGLIGPDGTLRHYAGSLAGTPVFLGCSNVDSHIPLARVEETASVLAGLGAVVDTRIYEGMGHTVNDDEVTAVRALVAAVADAPVG